MSNELFERASRVIPGGVNSPVRAFKAVGGDPVFVHSAQGPYITGENGTRYIDYVGSWGPMILGHAHSDVLAAVHETASRGLSFGAPTVLETELAEKICTLMPAIEQVRMVSSGTEATMSAIRLARGFTGRDIIMKFEGCYHGHSDSLLVKAGSGALTLGVPTSPGVPAAFARHTMTLPYNDADAVRHAFQEHGDSIACIIVEPIAGNMNFVQPVEGFLQTLREVCTEHGSVLIFDEVMTGFRVALGGAQAIYGVTPDMTTLGKIVGGGMPVGAFGGRRDIMAALAPSGPVYQAGTLSGNPVSMAAGLATLGKLEASGFYEALNARTQRLLAGLTDAANSTGVPFFADGIGGMFGVFFTEEAPVTTLDQASNCNQEHFKRFFHGCLEQGVYFAPSGFEAGFMSIAHSNDDIDKTVDIAHKVMNTL